VIAGVERPRQLADLVDRRAVYAAHDVLPGLTGVEGRLCRHYGQAPGDIVRSVNGAAINKVGELTRRSTPAITGPGVERGGRRLTLSVDG